MKKIAITGSNGTIGSILKKGLSEYSINSLDLPKYDVRNYKNIKRRLRGNDVVIHLAWDTKTDSVSSGKINPDNSLMFWNVYKGSLESKVRRVIMASSIHADTFYGWKKSKLKNTKTIPIPDSPYGSHKVFMESLGRYYAQQGLEVICIRFGGVIKNDKPPSKGNPYERAAWLSHRDCIELIKKCIEAKNVPNNFVIINGVSNNKKRIHDISNPFGWKPKDS